VVSSTSIKVPSITEMAMIHGLIAGFSVIYLVVSRSLLPLVLGLSNVSFM
jgi:hypothetical protein